MAARKLNAVVLDGKDYQGPVTYPTKVAIALETHAASDHPPIPDLARALRFAHARGIRVIMRIACFHDPWAAKHAPRLSLMGNWGGPFPMGWLDPTNVEAQDFMLDLAREQIAAGADEIQLDYVRFPVQATGIAASVVMPKPNGARSRAMRDFWLSVARRSPKEKHIPLSLDIFGVTATGDQSDIDKLGQDIGTIGGRGGGLEPDGLPVSLHGRLSGASPNRATTREIVGIGTKAGRREAQSRQGMTRRFIRSWLQASGWKSTNYGPDYLVKEAKSAEANGGVGWLLWRSRLRLLRGVARVPGRAIEGRGSALCLQDAFSASTSEGRAFGVADIDDELGSMAHPRGVLPAKDRAKLLAAIEALAREGGGRRVSMSGTARRHARSRRGPCEASSHHGPSHRGRDGAPRRALGRAYDDSLVAARAPSRRAKCAARKPSSTSTRPRPSRSCSRGS